jgi:hypothetical protein
MANRNPLPVKPVFCWEPSTVWYESLEQPGQEEHIDPGTAEPVGEVPSVAS